MADDIPSCTRTTSLRSPLWRGTSLASYLGCRKPSERVYCFELVFRMSLNKYPQVEVLGH